MFIIGPIFAFYCLNLLISTCHGDYCCDSSVASDAYRVSMTLSDSSTLSIQCPGRHRGIRPCFQDEIECNSVNGVNICRPIPNDCSPDFQTRDFWNTYEAQYRSLCGFDSFDPQCIIEIGANQASDNGDGDEIDKFKIYKVGHYYDVNDDDLSRWFIFTAGTENWGNINSQNGYNMNMDCIGRGGNGCKGDGGWSCPAQGYNTFGKDFLKHDICNYFWKDCQYGSCSSFDTHCGDEYSEGSNECLFNGKPLGMDKCFRSDVIAIKPNDVIIDVEVKPHIFYILSAVIILYILSLCILYCHGIVIRKSKISQYSLVKTIASSDDEELSEVNV